MSPTPGKRSSSGLRVRGSITRPSVTPGVILKTARRLFAQRGFDAVTVREIAAACGLTLPSIYHFFENKEQLYRGCLAAVLEAAAQTLQAALSEHASAHQRVERFTLALCTLLAEDGELLGFVQHENLRHPGWITASPLGPPLLACVELIDSCDATPRGMHAAESILAHALGQAIVRQAFGPAPWQAGSPDEIARSTRWIVTAACPDPAPK